MKITKKIIFLSFILLFLSSCVKDIDFNQAEQLELKPVLSMSLIKAEITQNMLVVGSIEKISLTDRTKINYFDNNIARENLIKLDINIEINNPFDREFELDFLFYDETGNVITYTIPTLKIPAKKTNFSHLQEISIATNKTFLKSRFIETTVRLLPKPGGSIIDVNKEKTFSLKSAGTFYFRID